MLLDLNQAPESRQASRWQLISQHYSVRCVLLAFAYVMAGKLGLLLAVPPGYATAIFPASGVALMAVLVFGYHLWPGVLLGSFALNLWIAMSGGNVIDTTSVVLALLIGSGASLQALVGTHLIRRYLGMPLVLDQSAEILKYSILAGALGCITSATVGISSLWLFGLIQTHDYLYNWFNWWVGDTLGVLIVTPILLSIVGQPEHVWRARRYSVSLPLMGVVCLVVFMFLKVSAWDSERLQNEFSRQTTNLVNNMQARIHDYIRVLEFIHRFYAASGFVDRQEFQDYTADLFERYPGFHALEWAPIIYREEQQRFEKEQRDSGYSEYQIKEQNQNGELIPATARPFYVPVTYLEPLQGNEQALGFDLFSNATRRQSLVLSERKQQANATAPITLVQENAEQKGFLVAQPIYYHQANKIPKGKKVGELSGFTVGVFRMEDLMKHLLADTSADHLRLQVYDHSNGSNEQLLYSNNASIPSAQEVLFQWKPEINLPGRTWSLSLTPTSRWFSLHKTWQSWAVLAAGLVFSVLMGGFLLLISGRTSRIEELVATRTTQLIRAKKTVDQNNSLLKTISDAQTNFITAQSRQELFSQLLSELLAITESEYGFIGEVLINESGKPYLKTRAITNIAWDEDTRRLYAENEASGLEFYNLGSLFGQVLETGATVIANDPSNDARACGIPPGHPPLNAFLGLPFYKGNELIGMVGIANRPDGYHQTLCDELQPFLATCATLIDAYRDKEIRMASVQALANSESKMRGILTQAAEAIIITNEHAEIESVNPAGERLFGYSEHQLQGRNMAMLLEQSDLPASENPLTHWLSFELDRESLSPAVQGIHQSGKRIPLELAVSRVKLHDRHIITVIIHDLTERSKIDKMKNEFISTVSHELRTPLTSIRGTLGLVMGGAMGEIPKPMANFLQIASDNSDRLVRLINDILDIEKIEFEGIQFDIDTLNLVEIVERSVEENFGYAQKFTVDLVFQGRPESEIWVEADHLRLVQVLTNLISNAIKFSPQHAKVTVELHTDQEFATVMVIDQGPGVSDEFASRIFQKFAQADSSDTRKFAGTGLGLSICKAIVEHLGGKIGYRNHHPGTCFYFSLPLKQDKYCAIHAHSA